MKATITIRRTERKELERHLEARRRLAERLSAEDRRRVAELRLAQLAALFATE